MGYSHFRAGGKAYRVTQNSESGLYSIDVLDPSDPRWDKWYACSTGLSTPAECYGRIKEHSGAEKPEGYNPLTTKPDGTPWSGQDELTHRYRAEEELKRIKGGKAGGSSCEIEGVPITCGREATRRFGGSDFRPMKPLPSESEAQAFAKRVRAGALAFPFNQPCVTKITEEPSGWMVWARVKDETQAYRKNPYPRSSPRHTAIELGKTRPRLSR